MIEDLIKELNEQLRSGKVRLVALTTRNRKGDHTYINGFSVMDTGTATDGQTTFTGIVDSGEKLRNMRTQLAIYINGSIFQFDTSELVCWQLEK